MGGPAKLAERALREVADRHAFFAGWFAGTSPEAELDAAMRSFAGDFRRIAPDGRETDRAALCTWLAGQRGTMPGTFSIAIAEMRVIFEGADCAVVSYREIQPDQAPPTRISTALFVADAGAPNGAAWLHVQETWITHSEGLAPSDDSNGRKE